MKIINKITAIILVLTMTTPVYAFSIKDIFESSENSAEQENNKLLPERGKRSPLYESNENRTNSYETEKCLAQSWYFKKSDNNGRPPIPPEMSYITEHNGYYLGKDEKVIYLTFDAGYENGNVEKILDILKEENVPAAFFVLENLVKRNTDLVIRMNNEGHTVCNHTASHKDMTKITTKEEFAAELDKMDRIYKEITGCSMAMYYRPPEGKISEENIKWADELGYKTIFWSFAYADWDNEKQADPEVAKQKLLAGIHNGEVLLLHPTSATNAAILGDLIKEWKAMGYRFGTLDEMTGG